MKTALVTGGARGIGAAVARRLAADGWRVVVADLDGGETGENIRTVRADVGDEADVARLVAGLAETGLDALVCNAGFMIRKPLETLTLAEWNSVLATNLTSSFLLAAPPPACCGRRGAPSSPSPPHARICPSRIPNPIRPPRAVWWRSPMRSR